MKSSFSSTTSEIREKRLTLALTKSMISFFSCSVLASQASFLLSHSSRQSSIIDSISSRLKCTRAIRRPSCSVTIESAMQTCELSTVSMSSG